VSFGFQKIQFYDYSSQKKHKKKILLLFARGDPPIEAFRCWLVGGDNMSEREHEREGWNKCLQRWKNPYQTYKITVGQKLVPLI
jgi:hypothetical protein